MEKSDYLRLGDRVTVNIEGPDGSSLYETTGSDFHSLEAAVKYAVDNANLTVSPEDCVFEVINQETGVAHRYRINAHGNLKLIV